MLFGEGGVGVGGMLVWLEGMGWAGVGDTI